MGNVMRALTVTALAVCCAAAPAAAQWTWTPQSGRWVNLKRLPKETPELQVEYARSLMLDGDHKKALRETVKFRNYYADSDFADENQYLRGEIRMRQGKWISAAEEFQQVVANYPGSERYDDVIAKQYEIGDSLFAKGESNLEDGWWRLFRKRPFRRAIDVYSMVIDNEPFTARAAEAQYKVGLCHFTLEQYIEAAYEYRRVIEDYAASEWVDEAAYGLASCYYEASLPPEYDQEPSLLAIAAVDDFKARFPGDARVSDLDEKRAEMREKVAAQRMQSARFYEKRRRFDAARLYYEVVVEQFPETTSAEEARGWLERNQPAAGSASNMES